jgi:hypothetical protein
MAEIAEWKKKKLDLFQQKTKESALTSLSNSVSFFLFSQWLQEHFESKQERNAARDQVFKAWCSQIQAAAEPVFSGINAELSRPATRWAAIIEGESLGIEDYQQSFAKAIRDIKEQFNQAAG